MDSFFERITYLFDPLHHFWEREGMHRRFALALVLVFLGAMAFIEMNRQDLLPEVLPAGARAGELTEAGALLLDPTGTLKPGIPFCPPEGDAGTGMVATNSIAQRTGNISCGTSVFLMVVL